MAKRAGLEGDSYQKALAALREMAAPHRRSPDELLAEVHAELERAGDD